VFARYRFGAKMYRSAFAVSNAGTACRWVRNAQVVITKAVLWHCHSEPNTALSIDSERVRATATPASAAIASIASAKLHRGKSHGRCSASFGCWTTLWRSSGPVGLTVQGGVRVTVS
jgi:hypothetical protein